VNIDELIQDAQRRMDKSIEATRAELNGVRTGRASATLLDRINVDYYGQKTPLRQLATIERAIQESDLGLTPSNDGKMIRLPIPQLTEERRKELVRYVRQLAEEGRVAVRNVRRDVIHHLKELVASGDVGADEEHRSEHHVQELTDEHTKSIDELLKHKETEILEV